MICFFYAKACVKANNNNEAITVLENYLNNKKCPSIKYFYYFLGTIELNRLDYDAYIYFNKYLNSYQGKNYIKASYQKLAWYYLLNKNYSNYDYYINKVKQLGSLNTEADKQAYLEVNQSVKLNEILLKSRLLFDGGYFIDAKKMLINNLDDKNFKSSKDKIEYLYRLARVYHKLNRIEDAKKYYKLVINKGKDFSYYFAKNSALQLALIYEDESNYNNAKVYFMKCLHINSNEYKNSIEFSAKAGLNRINNY